MRIEPLLSASEIGDVVTRLGEQIARTTPART